VVRLTVENLEGRELMAAGVLAGISDAPTISFTPPIGSNKGSVVSDSATRLVTGTAEGWAGVGAEPQANGIIAILIGLRAPTQPTPTAAGTASEMLVSSFQGGCANQGAGAQTATRVVEILPYLEQDNYAPPLPG
jgi:hypothetical protein